jgi:maltose alpha-D-glucosyltransferase/alpha-amylase
VPGRRAAVLPPGRVRTKVCPNVAAHSSTDRTPTATHWVTGLEMLGPGDLWYKDAVIYALNVETFQDSDADGIGDFPGLTSRVDYLHALGITCIWLQPFYPSPRRDNGYDIADYYAVDPPLGTLGDFVDFLRVSRERGIRVMIDLVVNHTSDQHPWFQAARRDPQSRYRDYYVWADEPPPNADIGMVFPGVEQSTWTRDAVAGSYYFHRFYHHEPDLNLANPAVREEIRKIMGFWLELGVSGFRVDAAPFLIERKGVQAAHVEARRPHTFFRHMRKFLSWRRGDAALLAEANVALTDIGEYVGTGDKLHLVFGFYVNQQLFLSLASERAAPLCEAIDALPPLPETAQWANFLRNHDELDLGRLSDANRDVVYAAFAPDAAMRLYDRGIRRRLAPMLGSNRARIELAHALMLALVGTPVLYYGDEIGMGDDLSRAERGSVRAPMQWSSSQNAGFSRAPAEQLVQPIVSAAGFEPAVVNVAAQQRDEHSLLNWLQRAIGVRKTARELSWGRLQVVPVNAPSVVALQCAWHGATLLTVHNLAAQSVRFSIPRGLAPAETTCVEILADREYEPLSDPRDEFELAAYGYRWLRFTASP